MLVVLMSLTACEFKLWPDSDDSDYYDDSVPDIESYLEDVEPYLSVAGGFSVKFPALSI